MRKPKQIQKEDSLSDIDADREDSWVIVKKQRVTILIPPLPHARKSIMPISGPSNLEATPVEVIYNEPTIPIEISNRVPSVDELDNVASLATNIVPKLSTKSPIKQISTSPNLRRLNVETESGNPGRAHAFKSRNLPPVSNISKPIKHPRLVHYQGQFLDGRVLMNHSLRALLLQKKLQKAGGLSRWLASIGLGQFVKIFRGNISKFQLVNLTMKKLKDMGADAVGPRRKLMHAIDCICQPYCFAAS
ncbi:Sterile alpha motif (SAM) domain-containing protein [Euphorbia peplus]|nr:Sterile alpha motif (SAM) domain-containing protein [Euphorbia peplus]